MKFWEAMKALDEGKKVRSPSDPENHYLIKVLHQVFVSANGKTYDKSHSPLGSLILQEWELYEEPEKMLTFSKVVEGLNQGKEYRRKGLR